MMYACGNDEGMLADLLLDEEEKLEPCDTS
jgi:hypothetical protein